MFRHATRQLRKAVDTNFVGLPPVSLSWAIIVAIVAVAIGRRKRIAWAVLVGYLSSYIAANIFSLSHTPAFLPIIALTVQITFVLILVAAHKEFSTRVRPAAPRRALLTYFVGIIVATGIGFAVVWFTPGTLPRSDRLPWTINHVALFDIIDPDNFSGATPHLVSGFCGLLGAIVIIATLSTLLRSQRVAAQLNSVQENHIRDLLTRWGDRDSLGYFATRRDSAAIFSRNGRAAITHRVEMGTSVASGDPVGDTNSWDDAINQWSAEAARYGWSQAVIGASHEGAKSYARQGLSALHIGDEAIIDTRDFSLRGAEMKTVRSAIARVQRDGISVRVRRHSELSDAEMTTIVKLTEQWRTGDERGFSMALSRIGDSADANCLLVEAIRADNEIVGILSFVPWGPSGISLDVMRRDRSAPNGVIELMTTHLATNGKSLGINKISLNFAMFREVFEEGNRLGAGPILRLFRKFLLALSRFWQLESLYRSNVKYQPLWVPRFACYAGASQIPSALLAILSAEGFLSLPRRIPRAATAARTDPIYFDDPLEPKVPQRLPEQVQIRVEKVQRLATLGIDAYPDAQSPTHTVLEALALPQTTVRVAGRVLSIRDHGGVLFAGLSDDSGQLQIFFQPHSLAIETQKVLHYLDIGDLIEIAGRVTTSRNGTPSIEVTQFRFLAKSLHPLPNKHTGLSDEESRVRLRYVDLMINQSQRELIKARSKTVSAIRDTLRDNAFLEVETPILQQIHGGANAEPFRTHINAYDLALYLRIAPELYLKRLCVGGFEKIFEIGRAFRNEGVDSTHNPEFTLLEAYAAHSDYLEMRDLCQQLICAAAISVYGRPIAVQYRDGERREIDLAKPWRSISVYAAVSGALGTEISETTPRETLKVLATQAQLKISPTWSAGQIVVEMYEHLVEAVTVEPTFYLDFPAEVSPLTKAHPKNNLLAQRWDLVAFGVELGTAYSELTNPLEQRARLTAQSLLAAGGDAEAMELDEDFLLALEYGMPPTGGLGLGVDRVVSLITGKSIRDTLPFPLVKPRE